MDATSPDPQLLPDGELSAIEQRLLGALLEKQVTVPASYPLSLNALRTACNQTSSREPVTDYGDRELEECARGLKHRELLRIVVADRGQRTLKYHQRLDERLGLGPEERALLTVLLLRGAQAPGELKTRTERLHGFADRAEVEAVLTEMAQRGLVRELPRRAGQHDNRWVHLLGPVEAGVAGGVEAAAGFAEPAVDREVVLADGGEARDTRVRAAYDVAAASYAEGMAPLLGDRPFDRWLLERVVEQAAGDPIADVGCGPGRVTSFLADRGADVTGYDLSPRMIEAARDRFPETSFEVGDLRRLLRPTRAAAWGAITSWLSLVYLAPSELPGAVAGLGRVLRPGGVLALAMHAGADLRHEDALAGQPVDVDLVLHTPEEVTAAVTGAGLVVQEWYLRGPVHGEYPTDRFYLLATRP